MNTVTRTAVAVNTDIALDFVARDLGLSRHDMIVVGTTNLGPRGLHAYAWEFVIIIDF